MKKDKEMILIGPVNDRNIGSIPMLNRAFMVRLSEKYNFAPFNINRKYGKSKVSNMNLINLFYLFKQYIYLIVKVLRQKPTVFHYAITSNWNFEKSLLFLRTVKFLGVKKAIGHLHGGSFNVFLEGMSETKKARAIRKLNSIDTVIVASNYWKEFLQKNNVIIPIMVVNNPIDLDYVSIINQKKKKERNNKFLFVGSLGKRKGFYDIIEVSKSIDKFVIEAVGSEDRKNDLNTINSLIDEHQLSSKVRIILSEKMSIEEKVNYFTSNLVFLFPSYNENFPLVIIEAACAGMPIISTKVGAIPEFFTHMKNIYFVTPGDTNEIKEAINFMINNDEERQKLGQEARKLYEDKLSEEIIMNQMDAVYQEVIS